MEYSQAVLIFRVTVAVVKKVVILFVVSLEFIFVASYFRESLEKPPKIDPVKYFMVNA